MPSLSLACKEFRCSWIKMDMDSFVTARDWTEIRETEFLDSEEYHKPCKIIDSSMLTLGKKIGRGAQATIFEGVWHNASGAIKVAVKRFQTHTAHKQWPDEILKLKGGNLCRLHGYVNLSTDTSTSLVMDRYDCDLRSLIDRKMSTNIPKPFTAETDLSLIVQIALGLRCLHAYGISHRDLKASNVLVVDSASKKVNIVISDFESSSNVVGTGFWRAPEILRALRAEQKIQKMDIFSLKSDIYSFGMTCYEILTGKFPLDNLRASDYEPVLSGVRPELPGDLNAKLCDLICKCWHDTPGNRPTACEIILELRQVVEEMQLSPIQELVTLFPGNEGFVSQNPTAIQQPNAEVQNWTPLPIPPPPPTISLFVSQLQQYVHQYGWPCFASYHFLSPEEAVQVLKLLDLIEDRQCETWRKLPKETIVRERCRNMNSIFVTPAARARGKEEDRSSSSSFEVEEYEKYVRELRLRWLAIEQDEGDAIHRSETLGGARISTVPCTEVEREN